MDRGCHAAAPCAGEPRGSVAGAAERIGGEGQFKHRLSVERAEELVEVVGVAALEQALRLRERGSVAGRAGQSAERLNHEVAAPSGPRTTASLREHLVERCLRRSRIDLIQRDAADDRQRVRAERVAVWMVRFFRRV